jgi:hypothetical protein
MRVIVLLFFILNLGAVCVRADTAVVSGVLLDVNGRTRAGGYTVKIYAGKPGVGEASDTTSSFGVFTVVKENVDSAALSGGGSSWYLVCDQGDKKASLPLVFERRPSNIWQAKVQDLKLVSTSLGQYTPTEVVETFQTLATIQAIKMKFEPSQSAIANEQFAGTAAQILGRTDLGLDPEATLRAIGKTLRQNYDSNLPRLPALNEDKFVLLIKRDEYKELLRNQDREPPFRPIPYPPGKSLTCRICVRSGGGERCETVSGNNQEELKAAALERFCGTDAACTKAATNSSNVTVVCDEP